MEKDLRDRDVKEGDALGQIHEKRTEMINGLLMTNETFPDSLPAYLSNQCNDTAVTVGVTDESCSQRVHDSIPSQIHNNFPHMSPKTSNTSGDSTIVADASVISPSQTKTGILTSIQAQSRNMQAELQKFMSLFPPSKAHSSGNCSTGYELTAVNDEEVAVINDEIRTSIQMLSAMLTANEANSASKKAIKHPTATVTNEDVSSSANVKSTAIQDKSPSQGLRVRIGAKSSARDQTSRESKRETRTRRSIKNSKVSSMPGSSVKLMYVCNVCDKTFSSKAWLKRHFSKHGDDRDRVDVASEKTTGDAEVKKEIASDDDNSSESRTNSINGAKVNCRLRSQTKRKGSKKIENKDRKNVDVGADDVKDEKVKSENCAPRVYKCEQCAEEFPRKGLKSRHMLSHGIVKPFSCDQCSRTFRFKSRLVRHRITHTDYKPFQCSECDRYFARKDILKSHMLIHTDRNRALTCEVCYKKFDEKPAFDDHVELHRVHKCAVCDARFLFACRLQRHMMTHGGDLAFFCSVCQKPFASQERLKVHTLLHKIDENYKPHLCNHCGKSFARRSSLYQHMLSHSSVRNHVCQICGMGFVNACKLRRHEVVHSSERPFQCDLCPSTFKLKTRLKSHRNGHGSDRTHVCPTCGKAFMQRQTLRAHQRTHTGVKPCECAVCGRRFISRHHLTRHMLTHSGDKPHLCCHCGKSFARKDKLAVHMAVHGIGQTKRRRAFPGNDKPHPPRPAQPPSDLQSFNPPSLLKQSVSNNPIDPDHYTFHNARTPNPKEDNQPDCLPQYAPNRFGSIVTVLNNEHKTYAPAPGYNIPPLIVNRTCLPHNFTDQALDYTAYHHTADITTPNSKCLPNYNTFNVQPR